MVHNQHSLHRRPKVHIQHHLCKQTIKSQGNFINHNHMTNWSCDILIDVSSLYCTGTLGSYHISILEMGSPSLQMEYLPTNIPRPIFQNELQVNLISELLRQTTFLQSDPDRTCSSLRFFQTKPNFHLINLASRGCANIFPIRTRLHMLRIN